MRVLLLLALVGCGGSSPAGAGDWYRTYNLTWTCVSNCDMEPAGFVRPAKLSIMHVDDGAPMPELVTIESNADTWTAHATAGADTLDMLGACFGGQPCVAMTASFASIEIKLDQPGDFNAWTTQHHTATANGVATEVVGVDLDFGTTAPRPHVGYTVHGTAE